MAGKKKLPPKQPKQDEPRKGKGTAMRKGMRQEGVEPAPPKKSRR